MLKSTLVLCLGNEVLSDDSFGPKVAEVLHKELDSSPETEILFLPVAGLALLDHLQDRQQVLIVDTIITGKAPPGTLHFFPFGQFTPSFNLTSSHQVSLPTAVALGKQLGYVMPEQIDVLAVEAADIETISEELTSAVDAAVPKAVERVKEWINQSGPHSATDEAE